MCMAIDSYYILNTFWGYSFLTTYKLIVVSNGIAKKMYFIAESF